MDQKKLIRKKYLSIRKKKYFEIKEKFFFPLKNLFKKFSKEKDLNISIYYPCSNEVNALKIFDSEYFKRFNFLLPIIEKKNLMNFYKWKKNDILILNKYGVPEPIKSKKIIPQIILVPILAFDKYKNRLGYGKGFYDRFLNKYMRANKKIITVGVAFSFQKHHKLPINVKDYKLDYIITEKGIQ